MDLRRYVRTIPDHPKPGIQFRDITTLLRDPEGLRRSIDDISDRHREQLRNVSDCYEKLRQLILPILEEPRVRKKTRPSRGSVERRLQKKQLQSKRKQMRRYRPNQDD